MGWPRGKPRPPNAGRKKGKLNRKTDALFDLCDEMGINPFEALLRLSQNIDVEIQLGALKEICKYLYPQRKAIEHTGTIETIQREFEVSWYDEPSNKIKNNITLQDTASKTSLPVQ